MNLRELEVELKACKTLKQLHRFVEAYSGVFRVKSVLSRATVSTDRKIPGSRLRRPGKGRTGARIQFFDSLRSQRSGEFWMTRPLFDHKNAETYRTVQDVRDWLFKRAQYVKTQARRQ